MPACQAWGCSNRNDRGRDVPGHGKSYFQIPRPEKDKNISNRWLHNMGTGWTAATFKFGRHKSSETGPKKRGLDPMSADIEVCSVSIGVQTDPWCADCGHPTNHRCTGPEAVNSSVMLDHTYSSSQSSQSSQSSLSHQEDTDDSNHEEIVPTKVEHQNNCMYYEPCDTSDSESVSSQVSNEPSVYEPSSEADSSEEECENDHIENIITQSKYIVFSDSLDEIFYRIPCHVCSCPVDEIQKSLFGSLVTAKLYCTGGHEVLYWRSQPLLNDHVSAGNVMLCASILFTGQTYKHIADVASLINLEFVGKSTFYDTQIDYLLPVIEDFWKAEQTSVLSSLQNSTVQVSGDGRCDSPGYSARYCNYTMMDHASLKILDFDVVEVTEAKSSAGMEKIGFEKVLDRLIGCSESETGMHVSVSDVSTDRHVSVRKLMREKYAPMNINHQFDAYHMANSLRKKLKEKCRYKKCSALAPWVQSICHLFWCAASCMGDADLLVARWESLRYHIVNIHHWDGPGLVKSCCHDVLTEDQVARKKWLTQDSPTHRVLEEIMLNRKFLEDIRRLSKFLHTGRLEVYHSLLNKYCPKRQDFDKKQMTGRSQLAALDHNKHTIVEENDALSSHEESSSSDVVTFISPDGVRVAYSKHCSDWVLKPIAELKSYSYLKEMIMEVLKRRKHQAKGVVKAKAKARNIAKKPKPSKELLLQRHRSRLRKC